MTTAADYTSVRFLEPFLNACDAPTLLAASAVCKTWAFAHVPDARLATRGWAGCSAQTTPDICLIKFGSEP